jgi:hypothetical protein
MLDRRRGFWHSPFILSVPDEYNRKYQKDPAQNPGFIPNRII